MIRPIRTIEDHLHFSEALTYQHLARGIGHRSLAYLIAGSTWLRADQEPTLIQLVSTVVNLVGNATRRLGPPGVLHPFRVASILSREIARTRLLRSSGVGDVSTSPDQDRPWHSHIGPVELDLPLIAVALFHDLEEDLAPPNGSEERWSEVRDTLLLELEYHFPDLHCTLREQLKVLTRRDEEEPYCSYIHNVVSGRPKPKSAETFIHANPILSKTADRIDCTLDLRVHLDHNLTRIPLERGLIRVLRGARGFPIRSPDQAPALPLGMDRHLKQLWKTRVFQTLSRQAGLPGEDVRLQSLFQVLLDVSIREATEIAKHLLTYHVVEVSRQRAVILEALEYARGGGLSAVTTSSVSGHRLDGTFEKYFREEGVAKENRSARIRSLVGRSDELLLVVLSFHFLLEHMASEPKWMLRGLSSRGLTPLPRHGKFP